MTVQQLLAWVAYAHDRHDCSFNELTGKHNICLKQALLEGEPKIESHGYGASEGEREVAIVLIHTCNYNEIGEMENDAYNISREVMNVETRVHRTYVDEPVPEPPPAMMTATEAIRQAEAVRAFANAPILHNTPNNERPVGEILYHQGVPVEMPSLPQSYLVNAEQQLTAAIQETIRNDVEEVLRSDYTQGATVANTNINTEFERFFSNNGL